MVILFSEKGMLQPAISGEKERSMALIKTWLDEVGEEEVFFLQPVKLNTMMVMNMMLPAIRIKQKLRTEVTKAFVHIIPAFYLSMQ